MTVELLPGAMEVSLKRELPTGTIEFEYASAGMPKKDGTPRKTDWRAYFWLPKGEEKKQRRVSVTTWLNVVCPKNLSYYGEREGVYGMAELVRRGEWDPREHTDEDALERVRALRLGVDAHRDRAAKRGLDMHDLLEKWMRDGSIPNPSDFPPEQRGYIQGLAKFIVSHDPEPVAVEQLVVCNDVALPYAGRVDLLARIGGRLTLIDLKTQPDAGIFAQAHYQAAAYARACEECGDGIPEDMKIVVLASDGAFRAMDVIPSPEDVDKALDWYLAYYPVDSACGVQNRIEKKARAA